MLSLYLSKLYLNSSIIRDDLKNYSAFGLEVSKTIMPRRTINFAL